MRDLSTQEGQEYWMAMNLAGDYAQACHTDIHRRLAKALGCNPVVTIENHHNFAWKEFVNGEECIVHRKGATPAGKGVLGVIPGSMTAPGFIVEGRGNPLSLQSASHGAGRVMSRSACKNNLTKSAMLKELEACGVELIGGALDESPRAYKDIHRVMKLQDELMLPTCAATPHCLDIYIFQIQQFFLFLRIVHFNVDKPILPFV